MGDSPDVPTPHDPTATAQTQQQLNNQAAASSQSSSMVNQSNPYGTLTYQQTGTGPNGLPLYTANTNLSPQMSAIVNSLQSGIGGQLQQGDYANTNARDYVGDATSGTTQWLLNQQVSYLQPFFTQQQEQLDAQLRNQGIGPESKAYTTAMNNLSQSQNQSVTGALAQFEPAAYQQATSSYMLPLTTAAAQYNMLDPSFFSKSLINPPQANVQPANYQGAVSAADQANMAAYQAQLQKSNAMMGGLFGIPSSILGGWAASPAGGAALTAGMAAI